MLKTSVHINRFIHKNLGTGVEAAFNVAVGSHDVNTLSDSTEQDDLKKRT